MMFDVSRAAVLRARAWRLAAAGLLLASAGVPGQLAAQQGPQSLAPVAERLIDAVVDISSTQVQRGPDGIPLPKVPKGSPFEDLFEDFFNRRGGQTPPADQRVSSLGSGFIIDATEGLIVTNNHVIDGADEIFIGLHDGTKLKVDKIIGKDSKTDLALLKVTPKKPLTAVSFGSSAAMKIGDWVMAIGNPLGLGGTVTLGIISAKQRDINAGPYDDFLQTDAAINKGNSGGPLFNMEGQVIGVNTAIISPTGGSIGIGFAVPSDTVMTVVNQLKEYGVAQRGWLGVKIQTITEEIAESLRVPPNTGALVAGVTPESPAAKAGLEAGDVIVTFDGNQVTAMRGLPRLVAQAQIGKSVDVEVMRRGEKRTVKVEVGRLDEVDDKPIAAADRKDSPEPPAAAAMLGLSLTPLTDEIRGKLGLDRQIKGVVVMDIDPASPAAEKNIRIGDVIIEAQDQPVATPEDVAAAIERARTAGLKNVLLYVDDGKGDTRFIGIPL